MPFRKQEVFDEPPRACYNRSGCGSVVRDGRIGEHAARHVSRVLLGLPSRSERRQPDERRVLGRPREDDAGSALGDNGAAAVRHQRRLVVADRLLSLKKGTARGFPRAVLLGAGDETRTRDLLLGKETYYHCTTPAVPASLTRTPRVPSWSGRRVSNPRQPAWKASALPTELLPHSAPGSPGCAVAIGRGGEI